MSKEEEGGLFDVGRGFHLLTLASFKTSGLYTHSLLVSFGLPNDLSMPRLSAFAHIGITLSLLIWQVITAETTWSGVRKRMKSI